MDENPILKGARAVDKRARSLIAKLLLLGVEQAVWNPRNSTWIVYKKRKSHAASEYEKNVLVEIDMRVADGRMVMIDLERKRYICDGGYRSFDYGEEQRKQDDINLADCGDRADHMGSP